MLSAAVIHKGTVRSAVSPPISVTLKTNDKPVSFAVIFPVKFIVPSLKTSILDSPLTFS